MKQDTTTTTIKEAINTFGFDIVEGIIMDIIELSAKEALNEDIEDERKKAFKFIAYALMKEVYKNN